MACVHTDGPAQNTQNTQNQTKTCQTTVEFRLDGTIKIGENEASC